MNANRCAANRKDGSPCNGTPLAGKAFCFAHDPELQSDRQRWHRENGAQKANDVRARKRLLRGAKTLEEIEAALCGALFDVLAGKLEPGIGNSAATIARSIAALKTAGDLEARIAALEERAQQDGRRIA